MNTMEITKIVGALCGSLLIFLLIQSGADAVIHGGGGHGHDDEKAYAILIEEDAPDDDAEEVAEVDFATVFASADAGSGERLFRACASCHKLEDGANGVGPHLFGVVGRNVSSADGFSYSGALVAVADVWTPENLNGFLEAPADWAPGTKMAYRGMSDVADRANLIAYLDSIDD